MNLYTFVSNTQPTQYLTSAKADVTVNGQLFTSITISRSKYVLDTIDKKNNMIITFAGDNVFARRFLRGRTGDRLSVIVSNMTGIPFYRGRLTTANYSQDNKVALTFEPPVRLDIQATGERRIYQRNCPYVLYDESSCQANKVNHNVLVTVNVSANKVRVRYDTGNTGNAVRSNPFDVLRTTGATTNVNIGELIGGLFVYGNQSYWIVNIEDQTVATQYLFFTLELSRDHSVTVNTSGIVHFGCARTLDACGRLHSNVENYGGFPAMVRESPFSGGLAG